MCTPSDARNNGKSDCGVLTDGRLRHDQIQIYKIGGGNGQPKLPDNQQNVSSRHGGGSNNTTTTTKFPLLFLFWLLGSDALQRAIGTGASHQMKLIQDMLDPYDRKAKPTWDNNKPVNVTFSMDLYQILELNEPQQFLLLNAWIIERWHDEFLYWNPMDYGNITELRLPYDCIWLPDTTLYNSLVMKDDDTRRLLNAKLTTNITRKAVLVELLYPTIYKFSCLLNLRYFPYDLQVCTMTFSSWTYDNKGIDYLPYSDTIGTSNFLENEAWYLLKTTVRRKEVKYSCCPNHYTLLKLTLYLRRKPLFYLINLIIPTAIITLIAIVGFFTTSAASGMREEKVSLGITTLLSMSILMLMVTDQMPTTSTFIPLISWFILGMIGVISVGTLASTVVIAVQKRGRLGERLTQRAVHIAMVFGAISFTEVPLHLRKGTLEYAEAPPLSDAYRRSARLEKKLAARTDRPTIGDEEFGADEKRMEDKDQLAKRRSFFRFLRRSFRSTSNRRKANGTTGDTNGKNAVAMNSERTIGGPLTRMPTDKSTEPLVAAAMAPATTNYYDSARSSLAIASHRQQQQQQQPYQQSTFTVDVGGEQSSVETGAGSPMSLRKQLHSSSLPPLPPPAAVLNERPTRFPLPLIDQTDVDDADASQASEMITPILPGKLGAIAAQLDARQAIGIFNENLRLSRQLAQKEYEWLATILERCCFIVFVILFLFLSLGINYIGYLHWSNPDAAFNYDDVDHPHTDH